jgi:hypothetical protein
VNRDQLARHLYIHAHDDDGAPQSWRDAGAEEWDTGQAKPQDVADCYARADQMIANGKEPQ